MTRKREKRVKPLSRTETLITPVPQSARKSELNTLKALDLVEFNGRCEKEFVQLVADFIREEGEQTPKAIYSEAAFELNISIETAKRYLLKHTARRAEFKVTDGKVGLK